MFVLLLNVHVREVQLDFGRCEAVVTADFLDRCQAPSLLQGQRRQSMPQDMRDDLPIELRAVGYFVNFRWSCVTWSSILE